MTNLNTFYTASIGYLSSALAGFSLGNVGVIVGMIGVITTTTISYLRYKLEVKKLNHSITEERQYANTTQEKSNKS